MKTSIATVSISGTFREKLAAIAAAGFDGIEIFEQDFLASDLSPRETAAMVRDHGLEIYLFQPFRDFEGLPEPLRERAFSRAERKFDLMGELGTDLVLFCSSVHPQALGGIDRAADDFHALGDIATRRGIRVGYEALCWGRYIDDHRDAWEVVRRADHPNIGLIVDSFHTLARKIDPQTLRRIPGDKIFFVQMADAPAIDMDLLYWSRHFRNMPGEGDLDVTGFTRAVLATGYKGPLSLEIFNDQFRSGPPGVVARSGYRSLIAVMDHAHRDEPTLPTPIPDLPAPTPVERVEFMEFATNARDVVALETVLGQAGFEPAGQHLSKPVTLWRQGGINLLINVSQDGFSHTSWVAHGTSVSEIGLTVPDAQAATRRAIALGAQPHSSAPAAAGELDIPGVRHSGGGILRFLDHGARLGKIWDTDFAVTLPTPAGIGLTHVDHIAQTVPYDEMLSWSLFYTTLFDARRSSIVDVIDPYGVVRSQVVESGWLRVTLNGAEARRTLAGQFIEETYGASVQHIAFATDDIFATANALLANGFPVLHIAENYYGDLAARFGLAPDVIARLQRLNMFYDEDDNGQFWQVFSQPLAGGLFLEFVQRAGGYAGYGGPNAPFRIAAMKRHLRPAGLPRL